MEEETRVSLEMTHRFDVELVKASIQDLKRGQSCYVYKVNALNDVLLGAKKKNIECRYEKSREKDTNVEYWVITPINHKRKWGGKQDGED